MKNRKYPSFIVKPVATQVAKRAAGQASGSGASPSAPVTESSSRREVLGSHGLGTSHGDDVAYEDLTAEQRAQVGTKEQFRAYKAAVKRFGMGSQKVYIAGAKEIRAARAAQPPVAQQQAEAGKTPEDEQHAASNARVRALR